MNRAEWVAASKEYHWIGDDPPLIQYTDDLLVGVVAR